MCGFLPRILLNCFYLGYCTYYRKQTANLSNASHNEKATNGLTSSSRDDALETSSNSDLYTDSHMRDYSLNGISSGSNSWSQRESFLTYFFGSGNKADRTVIPDQGSSGRSSVYSKAIPMDMDELEKKFDSVRVGKSIQH